MPLDRTKNSRHGSILSLPISDVGRLTFDQNRVVRTPILRYRGNIRWNIFRGLRRQSPISSPTSKKVTFTPPTTRYFDSEEPSNRLLTSSIWLPVTNYSPRCASTTRNTSQIFSSDSIYTTLDSPIYENETFLERLADNPIYLAPPNLPCPSPILTNPKVRRQLFPNEPSTIVCQEQLSDIITQSSTSITIGTQTDETWKETHSENCPTCLCDISAKLDTLILNGR